MQVPHPSRDIKFLLDECLPYRIADSLRKVGFNITSSRGEGVEGWEDERLIPWLGSGQMVWITKDDSARRGHDNSIQRARISVVWIRGTERTGGTTTRNNISLKEVLHVLVAKLDDIGEQIAEANGPRFFLLHMKGKSPVATAFPQLELVGRRLAGGRRGQREPRT